MARKSRRNLSDVTRVWKKHIAALVWWAMAGMVVASIISFNVLPARYEAVSRLVIYAASESQTAALRENRTQLIDTYQDIIKTPAVLDKAITAGDLAFSSSQLKENIDLSRKDDSLVLTLRSWAESADQAEKINEAVLDSFQTEVKDIFPTSQLRILEDAKGKAGRTHPKPVLDLGIGLSAGLICGLLYYMIRALRDKTVRSEELVTNLGWELLGVLPEMSHDQVRATRFKQRMQQVETGKKRI